MIRDYCGRMQNCHRVNTLRDSSPSEHSLTGVHMTSSGVYIHCYDQPCPPRSEPVPLHLFEEVADICRWRQHVYVDVYDWGRCELDVLAPHRRNGVLVHVHDNKASV